MFLFYSLSVAFLSILLANPASGGGNTTCAGSALDWYTTTVGETPCMTYQRLRQICNSEYEVPSFRPNTPGDNCDDQLSACCCNSISWALSMLCMNCQWDTPSSSVNGIDAGVPAYYMYRFSSNDQYCGDGTNQSLSASIQEAVCNEDIKLQNFLYNLFWNTGAWFYTYTREAAQQDEASDGDNIYYCSSSTTSSATSSTSTTAVATSPSSDPSTSVSLAPAPSGTAPSSLGTYSSSSPASGVSTTGPESISSPSSAADHTFSSSFVTTLESQVIVDGTATSVPYITTVVTTVPSSQANGTAVGLGATGSGRKGHRVDL
ncbi:hypothetical protein DAEQUDRAFT_153885 [Daedalea quercina L-15889]|uniref:Uncharacterized protein n=1 Tax=Daedalea quercina L-15889 TaxID=1314783 RepID=A0A165RML4_9APHY|nr:hypothetical protein DAEQUDRAFT_153885 [Daedalea quercina L-15889]